MNLSGYDVILINTSGGKDSQAMMDYVVEMARAQGVTDRLVAVHCDLGRVEWKGTRGLAEEQAKHYGLRFEVVSRAQDLLDQVEQRGMWPSNTARYCTSDHKRAQVYKLLTKLVTEHRGDSKRTVRILNCMGLRAQESSARAKKVAYVERDAMASNGKRHVSQWLPIHDWTEDQVWARIKASGVRYHHAYDLGMPRLSCCFCIFAPKAALMLAGRENPELLDQYVAVEQKINHTFRADLSLASVRDALRNGGTAVQSSEPVTGWCM